MGELKISVAKPVVLWRVTSGRDASTKAQQPKVLLMIGAVPFLLRDAERSRVIGKAPVVTIAKRAQRQHQYKRIARLSAQIKRNYFI